MLANFAALSCTIAAQDSMLWKYICIRAVHVLAPNQYCTV